MLSGEDAHVTAIATPPSNKRRALPNNPRKEEGVAVAGGDEVVLGNLRDLQRPTHPLIFRWCHRLCKQLHIAMPAGRAGAVDAPGAA